MGSEARHHQTPIGFSCFFKVSEGSQERLGASWGRLGVSFGRLGGALGRLGGDLGASWGRLGASWGSETRNHQNPSVF